MCPTRTPNDLEKRIIRNFIQQELKWCFHPTESCRESVNEKSCGGKHITPKLERNGGMGKQSKTSLNYMMMLTLSYTVLLMCMRTRHTMCNSKLIKECIEVVILTPPIGLHMNDFMTEQTLNMHLELQENIKHIRLAFKKIKPSEPTVSINETNIIIMTTNRGLGMAPYIRKHKFKRFTNYTTRLRKGS